MLARLLLVFILVPLVELAILVWLGTVVGFWPTIGLVLATGTVGALLAKSQGIRVLRAIRTELALGRVPAAEMVDGLLVLVGGITLLTPGLLSDLFGLALLIPTTRRRLRSGVSVRMEGMVRSGEVRIARL